MRSLRYRIDTSGSRNAAFIILVRTGGSEAIKAAARRGLVDQTKDDVVGERGRKAMGPVGRNRWYAVVFGPWNAPRRGWNRVATIA